MIKIENTSYIEIQSRQEYIDFLITRVIENINNTMQIVDEFNMEQSSGNVGIAGVSIFGFGINISIDEAIRNALIHGNARDVNKRIFLSYTISPTKLEVSIEDQGEGFDVHQVVAELSNAEKPKTGGRGILLMKNFMDKVIFNKKGNKVTLIKFRAKKGDNSLL
ncbi:ATP-binding protein [bacterium]|nr:ATP-binding protein [bacterium]